MVPTVAGDLHEEHLGKVARDALQQGQLRLEVGGAETAVGGSFYDVGRRPLHIYRK